VLVIDYAPVDSNPGLIIKSIRDELVQIADGVHLGRMLWTHGDGHHTNSPTSPCATRHPDHESRAGHVATNRYSTRRGTRDT
jgi:hypothetical protein